jgi:hypothetical protein
MIMMLPKPLYTVGVFFKTLRYASSGGNLVTGVCAIKQKQHKLLFLLAH